MVGNWIKQAVLECRPWSGSKPFDNLIVFLKKLVEIVNFENSHHVREKATKARKITQNAKRYKLLGMYIACLLWFLLSILSSCPQIRVRNWKLIYLFHNQNICCGYSKEPSWWDGSFEHPKHIFKLMDKKIIAILRLMFCLTAWPYIRVFDGIKACKLFPCYM